MKQKIYILFLFLSLSLTALAQKDLNIGRIFSGHYRKNPAVTDVEIKGSRLQDYNLTYYHSLTVKGDAKIMEEIRDAFVADEAKATDKELTNVGGKIYTGLYRLKYDGETNRFVFFKDMRLSPSKKSNSVIIIYMEGNTSLKALQNKFKK